MDLIPVYHHPRPEHCIPDADQSKSMDLILSPPLHADFMLLNSIKLFGHKIGHVMGSSSVCSGSTSAIEQSSLATSSPSY